jgi:hypothetical protein
LFEAVCQLRHREVLIHELIHAAGAPGQDPGWWGYLGYDDLGYMQKQYSKIEEACGGNWKMGATTPGEAGRGISRSFFPTEWQARHVLTMALMITAALNTLRLVRQWVSVAPNTISSSDFTVIVDPSLGLLGSKFRIAAALVIAAVALCFGRGKTVTISFAALAWAMIEYATWAYRSYVSSRNMETAHWVYLLGGTWWDLWVIATIVVLLGYQFKTALLSRE